jgi:hypothetical protein
MITMDRIRRIKSISVGYLRYEIPLDLAVQILIVKKNKWAKTKEGVQCGNNNHTQNRF